jgi:hypothetical protein
MTRFSLAISVAVAALACSASLSHADDKNKNKPAAAPRPAATAPAPRPTPSFVPSAQPRTPQASVSPQFGARPNYNPGGAPAFNQGGARPGFVTGVGNRPAGFAGGSSSGGFRPGGNGGGYHPGLVAGGARPGNVRVGAFRPGTVVATGRFGPNVRAPVFNPAYGSPLYVIYTQRIGYWNTWYGNVQSEYLAYIQNYGIDASNYQWHVAAQSSYSGGEAFDANFVSAAQAALDACQANTAYVAPDGVGDMCQVVQWG